MHGRKSLAYSRLEATFMAFVNKTYIVCSQNLNCQEVVKWQGKFSFFCFVSCCVTTLEMSYWSALHLLNCQYNFFNIVCVTCVVIYDQCEMAVNNRMPPRSLLDSCSDSIVEVPLLIRTKNPLYIFFFSLFI